MKPSQDSPHFPNAFYRVTAKGLCVRNGKVLVVHDFVGRGGNGLNPTWELPGGGLDFGEDFQEALRREVREEMGLTVAWMEDKPTFIWTTKHAGRRMEWYWVCTVIFRFDVVDLNFTPSKECQEIRFFSKEDLQEHIADLATQIKPLAEHFDPLNFK